jgi:hypothetical protein
MSTDPPQGMIKDMAKHPRTGVNMILGSDLGWVDRSLLKVLRVLWRHRSIQKEHANTEERLRPSGPFETTRRGQLGDLLLWVPRRIDSYLIDELTGGYGYSHTTVDTGEIDVPTRKPVMAEITIGQMVTRSFQEEYGQRAFVRVPLAEAGINVKEFVECVKSKMGEQYDGLGAITLGEIEDPAKEVCSELAADCLPQSTLRQIAEAKRFGLLRPRSVSVHSKRNAKKTRSFISPNGFAEYYGMPQGREVRERNTRLAPRPVQVSMRHVAGAAARRHGWKLAALALGIILLALVLKRRQ